MKVLFVKEKIAELSQPPRSNYPHLRLLKQVQFQSLFVVEIGKWEKLQLLKVRLLFQAKWLN